MDWREEGLLISVRPQGETSVIIEVFTRDRGRYAGLVRGGISRKIAPHLQPGTQLDLSWRARLEDQLGHFTIEPLASRAAILSDRLGLMGLNAVCAMLRFTLADRDPHPLLYTRTQTLLDQIAAGRDWPPAYLLWEMALLEELGFGLDLARCAVTGARDDLAYVSPRTGRAVSRTAAGDWAARLLPLPAALMGQSAATPAEISDGLRTTGHFLDSRIAAERGRPLPEARHRLVEALARRTAP
ncbi:DNA repair protein RecO [Frigidibacter sp. MR17.14]|uniref:DNA repair protein RecO n=1 Tax=Frigidibacter sp. MR17.14 TaxID=3126509 RepID=UPI003012F789